MNFWTLQQRLVWVVIFFPAFTRCSFTKGWILDSIVTWLSYIGLRGVQVVPAMFLISLSTFLFLTSDISGSCWHLIFKWKWFSWMKGVPLQPSRHRWHLSLVFKESVVFCINEAFMDKIDWTFTFALYFFEVWHCHQENSRNIYKLQFFKDKLGVIPRKTLFHFRSYSIRSYSNLDLIPTLCNLACQNFRSYSIRSYSLGLIPTSTC